MVTARVPNQHRRRAVRACNTCKRRKERCDGHQPCTRCRARKVGDSCTYLQPGDHSHLQLDKYRGPAQLDIKQPLLHVRGGDDFCFGDTAGFSILQRVRSLVATSLGPCQLVEEPLQGYLTDFRSTAASWGNEPNAPNKPSHDEAQNLLDWALRATGKLLGVHRDTNIAQEVQDWLYQEDTDDDPYNAMFWIILAVGAQSCPDDRDKTAEAYFRRGSFILTRSGLDHANTTSIQAYIWITFYLLQACRRHAAISALASAVRGAYAIGLHVFGYSSPLQKHDLFRERLWRTLRILDLYISSSLGRPPSTYEIRNVESRDADSFINDLAQIHEIILKEIHTKKGQSAEQFTYDMMVKHRSWTHRLHTRNANDDVAPLQKLGADDWHHPNGPVLNVKQAYYWSIMLLTWPYLLHRASECNPRGERAGNTNQSNDSLSSLSPFWCIAVSACVDSAVQTIDILSGLLSISDRPKRLPYAINSVFLAALTLGTATFANLDRDFPIERSMQVAQKLLRTFQSHDPLAKRYLDTIEHLHAAGEAHIERRCRRRMETHRHMTMSLLGDIDGGKQTPRSNSHIAPPASEQQDNVLSPVSVESNPGSFDLPKSSAVSLSEVHSLETVSGMLSEETISDGLWGFVDIAELVNIDAHISS